MILNIIHNILFLGLGFFLGAIYFQRLAKDAKEYLDAAIKHRDSANILLATARDISLKNEEEILACRSILNEAKEMFDRNAKGIK